MKSSSKRPLIMALILCVAILIGFVTDAIWSYVEKEQHPINYEEIVSRYSEKYNVPKDLLFAVIKVESDFDPQAMSSAGALGLMQMMPKTFEELTTKHLCENLPFESLTDPEVSIRYGTYYLAYLYRYFDYNWHNAIAAYNGGLGNVSRWLKSSENVDENGNLVRFEYKETRSYVHKVEQARTIYQELYPEA